MDNLYESDYCAWIQQQLAALRQLNFNALDVDNLIEELEGLVHKNNSTLDLYFQGLIRNLLVLEYQLPSKSNKDNYEKHIIEGYRKHIKELLSKNQSLNSKLDKFIASAYKMAIDTIIRETGRHIKEFPGVTPYTKQQLLDSGWFPNE